MRLAFAIAIALTALLSLVVTGQPIGSNSLRRRLQDETPVFINEFHYDNDGKDVNEFIEIALPGDMSETDAKAHLLLLYNGKTGKRYKRFELGSDATFIPDFVTTPSFTGLRMAVVDTDRFRNGADGIVLMEKVGGSIVQFICYEGNVAAINGEASGSECRELINVEEKNTPINYSLQLGGTGCVYEDFTWQNAQINTRGGTNAGQTIDCGSVTQPAPSDSPSSFPSGLPSLRPSGSPSSFPSNSPSKLPSLSPSDEPSLVPSYLPSDDPTGKTTSEPSSGPSMLPSPFPSADPSSLPSSLPSLSVVPTGDKPSSDFPSFLPSSDPSTVLSSEPSMEPSQLPSLTPSDDADPSSLPSSLPSLSVVPTAGEPSPNSPSFSPSSGPSTVPSMETSQLPSLTPIDEPSSGPTFIEDTRTRDDICPQDRLNPPEKFQIQPFTGTVSGVEDDLNEMSSIVFSDQTSPGSRYAYSASDKEQKSLKVLKFSDNIFGGTGECVATYTLDITIETNDDWEAIALGPCTDSNDNSEYTIDHTCIFIGSIGNNRDPKRNVLRIFKFVEPLIDMTSPQNITDQSVAIIEYAYDTTNGFSSTTLDAEGMFVDWVGVRDSASETKGDIYIVTKNEVDKCNAGVGKIPITDHKNVAEGSITSSVIQMAKVSSIPSQGASVTCSDGPFRAWTGADMRRDGRLITLIRAGSPASVHFFPRLAEQSVAEAFSVGPCHYVSPTAVGLPHERKHEAVAFVDVDGMKFADISECQGSCSPNLYVYDLVYPDSDVEPIVAPITGWSEITSDNFELGWGHYLSGGSSASVVQTLAACGGSAAAEILDDQGVASSFFHWEDQACQAFDLLRITFQFAFDGYDPLDTLFVECSLDGDTNYHIIGSWTRGLNGYNNEYICYDGSVLLSPTQFNASGFGNNVRLRFRSSANSNGDKVYVDSILFQGHSSSPTGPPLSVPSSEPSMEPSEIPSLIPSDAPTPGGTGDYRDQDDICPEDRLNPPEKFQIQPYVDTNGGDLNEISSIVFSDQTSPGSRYAYTASDQEQNTLKVLKFTDYGFGGTGECVATYTLDITIETNDDWEAIALGPCTDSNDNSEYTIDQTCIYIGSIGNNRDPKRNVLRIFKFVEPLIDMTSPQNITDQSVAIIEYSYDTANGFSSTTLDAEGMFVDWAGVHNSGVEKKGDIYIVTKNEVDKCDAGVGKISIDEHKNVAEGTITSSVIQMAKVSSIPSQGAGVTCSDGPFRAWTGADMRRDGRLISLIRKGSPASVHFFPRLAEQSVTEALSGPPCPYASPTSVGLPNEKKHESVAFVDIDGTRFADISECEGSCSPTLYVYDLLYPDSGIGPIDEPTDGWSEITSDNFELGWGHYQSGGLRAALFASLAPCGGNEAVQIWDDYGVASSFFHSEDHACQMFDLLRVTFQFVFDGYDPFDTLFAECSLNGGTVYHIVGSWTLGVHGYNDQDSCYDGSVLLSPSQFNTLGFSNEVRLRFRSSANSSGDKVFVDNILFEGHVA